MIMRRKTFLKVITWIAGVVWALSVCCLDSDTWIPLVLSVISGSWLFLMAIANGVTYIEPEGR
jgi:hypothetical protein